ncbi:MAG: hypothetical protein AAGA60_18045 [Cyanobacteria bacterium P01_E01_bin.42]
MSLHVVSDIRKQDLSLSKSGYQKIIGLRDLYPKALAEKRKLEQSIDGAIKGFLKISNPDKTIRIPIRVILAVMEIEAWFLAEHNFLARLDERLTPDFILKHYGFDLRTIDIETREHPSQDLDEIYQLIDRTYNKSLRTAQEIVAYLDYKSLYLELAKTVPQLQKLIDEIDRFMQ